jgi:hypothetical protein
VKIFFYNQVQPAGKAWWYRNNISVSSICNL